MCLPLLYIAKPSPFITRKTRNSPPLLLLEIPYTLIIQARCRQPAAVQVEDEAIILKFISAMSSETEVVRRNKGTTRKVKKSSRQQNGDSSKGTRRNRRRDARNKQLALNASIVGLLLLFLVLVLRRGKNRSTELTSDRYARAKALRDAALQSGKSFLRKTKTKLENATHRNRRKPEYNIKKKFKGMRYLDPRQLPPLPGEPKEPYKDTRDREHRRNGFSGNGDDEWQELADSLPDKHMGPKVDYVKHKYKYPELVYEPANDGSYPPLESMTKIFQTWEQDDLDSPPDTIVEVLQHFDYQDPEQLEVS